MAMEYQDLACRLTDDEVAQKADELASRLLEKKKLDLERTVAANRFKDQLKDIDGSIATLANTVRTHEEYRSVACVWKRDDGRSLMVLIRTDTGEQIDMREQRPDERQVELAIVEPIAGEAAAPAPRRRGRGSSTETAAE